MESKAFLMSKKIPIVYIPSSMNLVIFLQVICANFVYLLGLNPYLLSLNSIYLSIYIFNHL